MSDTAGTPRGKGGERENDREAVRSVVSATDISSLTAGEEILRGRGEKDISGLSERETLREKDTGLSERDRLASRGETDITGLTESERLGGRQEKDTGLSERERLGEKDIAGLSQRELDDLAMLFTIREERCFSRASRDTTPMSLTSSQLADAAFIYQRIDFEVLSKCVPGFVKTHLNKNGRYLPETFILRVNYWRRRRALGEDSTTKRAAKEAARAAGDTAATSTPRAGSARSARPQSSTSRHTVSETRVTMISA